MGQLQEVHTQLVELGYQIIAISPTRPAKLETILKSNTYDYTLLSDSSMLAAQQFGIAWKVGEQMLGQLKGFGIDLEESSGESHHVLPVPSVFIVDTEREVRFTYVNPDYKVRIDPSVLLAAAKAAAP